MKTFTVHVRGGLHQRLPVIVRASDFRHARRKALKRAGLDYFTCRGAEPGSVEGRTVEDAGQSIDERARLEGHDDV